MEYQPYSGAGNKFLIADAVNYHIHYDSKSIAEFMSRPENNLYDGIIFVRKSSKADFLMHYFNIDGSDVGLCGNGLRCTAQFIRDNNLSTSDELNIEAVGNVYKCVFQKDNLIKAYFPPPITINPEIRLNIYFDERTLNLKCAYVNVSSPHIVIFIDEMEIQGINTLDDIDVHSFGQSIRMHKDLMPEGANVNFVQVKGNELAIRTYERGVERETLACGTGALSSAVIAYIKRNINPPVKILTRSGDYLIVDFEEENDRITSMSLAGPAIKII